MLKIGKASQYFTLWSIDNETRYTSRGQAYEVTNYSYMGRLSKDKQKAIKKAELRGCSDLVPDESLRGKSWTILQGYKSEREIIPEDCFQYGKYRKVNIKEFIQIDWMSKIWNKNQENTDGQKYLRWYFQEQHPEDQKKLVKLIPEILPFVGMVENRGYHTTLEDLDWFCLKERIKTGRIRVQTQSNFGMKQGADHMPEGFFSVRIAPMSEDMSDKEIETAEKVIPYGFDILIKYDGECKSRFYNGFHYWVPAGMRSFKNKILVLEFNAGTGDGSYLDIYEHYTIKKEVQS